MFRKKKHRLESISLINSTCAIVLNVFKLMDLCVVDSSIYVRGCPFMNISFNECTSETIEIAKIANSY